MLNLVNYFAVVVGLFVPEDLPAWNLYLDLQNIVILILRKKISLNLVDYLSVLIGRTAIKVDGMGSFWPTTVCI